MGAVVSWRQYRAELAEFVRHQRERTADELKADVREADLMIGPMYETGTRTMGERYLDELARKLVAKGWRKP